MVKDAEQHANEDAKKKELVETRNMAEGMVTSTEKMLEENKDKATEEEVASINDANDKLKKLYLYDEKESIDISMSNLETKHSGKELTFLQQILGNIGVGGMGRGTIIGSGKADN